MKKLLLFILVCLPLVVSAQKLKYSRAYVGALLHDSRIGGSVILSYGINQYLGVGAGVDLTTYINKGYSSSNSQSKLFAPFFLDLRIKYPLPMIEPFVYGQFGKPAYNEHLTTFTDVTGAPSYKLYQNGKYFYGIGLGASSRQGRVGFFAAATYRLYKFSYSPDNVEINGRPIPGPEDKEAVVISAGLLF